MNIGGDLFKEMRGSAGEVGMAGGEGDNTGKGVTRIYFMYIHEIIKVNSSAKTQPVYGVV